MTKNRFKQHVSTNPAIQKVLEGNPQPKEGNCIHKNTGNRNPPPKKLKEGKPTMTTTGEKKKQKLTTTSH